METADWYILIHLHIRAQTTHRHKFCLKWGWNGHIILLTNFFPSSISLIGNTSILMPLATVNNARRVSHDCISAEYSVQTGYCPSTFIAMYDLSRSDWKYPSTSSMIL